MLDDTPHALGHEPELAESSVNLAARPWCATGDYWSLFFDLNERVKAAFDEAGVTIPFPQRELRMRATEAPDSQAA